MDNSKGLIYIPSVEGKVKCPNCHAEVRNVHGEISVHFRKLGWGVSKCCEGSLQVIKN